MIRMSPAQRHKARVLAEQAAASTEEGKPTGGNAYELMLFKLAEDRRRLKKIQSIKQKITVKTELLPEYQDWIDAVLRTGRGGQDDVLTTMLVWYIDCGEYQRALQVAEYAIKYKMTLPDQYNRDIPTLLMDEFAGAYLTAKMSAEVGCAVLPMVIGLTDGKDAPDQALAKLYKALAYSLLGKCATAEKFTDDLTLEAGAEALNHLTHALELDKQVGVMKDIENLKRFLAKSQQA